MPINRHHRLGAVLLGAVVVLVGLALIWTPAASLLTLERAEVDLARARSALEADRATQPSPADQTVPETTPLTGDDPPPTAPSPGPGAEAAGGSATPPEAAPQLPRHKKVASPTASPTTIPDLEDDLVVVMVGSDARASKSGARADAIVVAHAEAEPDTPLTLISVPRDLNVDVPCWGTTRINAALNGCDRLDINGLELVALTIEEWADITVDHVVAVDFGDFASIVNTVGGHEVCIDHDLRDRRADLELGAGCQTLNGDETLGWMRSRQPEVLIDGLWQSQPLSDLERTDRQRELLVGIFEYAVELRGRAEISDMVEAVAASMTFDSEWSISSMASVALALREREVRHGVIEVTPFTGAAGEELLDADETYTEARIRLAA